MVAVATPLLAVAQRRNGFTLAEMLVVILVIGLAAGFAYARLDADPRQTMQREAQRLAAALEHAAALAQWRNQTLGVAASGADYRFWRREPGADGDRWVPVTDDDVLQAHALPADITATVRDYAGQPVAADAILPLAASGRNEPFTIVVTSPEWRVLLVADPLNRVALTAASPR
ncbi:MAG: GspH/FimT family pseudopilin [Casimicrobiaceae bacterium]